MINKHHNWDYDSGIPTMLGDRYRGQDLLRDFYYLMDSVGMSLKDMVGIIPVIVSGGIVTQGSGDTLNITSGSGYAKHAVVIPDSFASTPPTSMSADIEARRVAWTAQTNLAIAGATLDGETVNYVKVKYAESNGEIRARKKKAGSYAYERIPSYTITVDSISPVEGTEIVLATFTGSTGGTFTFSTLQKTPDIKDEMGAANLVYNPDLNLYSNATGTSTYDLYLHPDGYVFTGTGGTPLRGYDSAEGAFKMVGDGSTTLLELRQSVHEVPRLLNKLKGKRVTFRVKIKTASTTAKIRVEDGAGNSEVAVVSGGNIVEHVITHTMSATATKLDIVVKDTTASVTICIYRIEGNVGWYAKRELPDLVENGVIGSVWQGFHGDRYPETVFELDATEIPSGYTRLGSVLNLKFGTGSNSRSKLPSGKGRFLRVWANGATQDPDRSTRTDRGDGTIGDKVGTLQEDAMQGWRISRGREGTGVDAAYAAYADGTYAYLAPVSDGTHGTPRISSESRSININILAGIRWA